jgi:hypothetical protein
MDSGDEEEDSWKKVTGKKNNNFKTLETKNSDPPHGNKQTTKNKKEAPIRSEKEIPSTILTLKKAPVASTPPPKSLSSLHPPIQPLQLPPASMTRLSLPSSDPARNDKGDWILSLYLRV